MLLLVVLIFLILNGNSWEDERNNKRYEKYEYGSVKESTSSEESNEDKIKKESRRLQGEQFYIELRNVDLNYGGKGALTYNKDSSYLFEIGHTIEITCKQHVKGKSLSLQWKDMQEFKTGISQDYTDNGIRIIMKPNIDDNVLTLTCYAYGPEVNRTISLTMYAQSNGPTIEGIPIFLEKGHAYTTNETCSGLVHYPKPNTESKITKVIYPNAKIIESFNESLNGTTLICITYKKLGVQPSLLRSHSEYIDKLNIDTYERLTSKFIFKLKPERTENSKMQETFERGTLENVTGRQTKSKTTASKTETGQTPIDSQNSGVGIVGGILGAIILFLMSILLAIWYRKILRQSNFDGAADQVIYAEIEDLPPRVPPPRPIESPYAKILGTLVPKVEQLPTEDHLYCSMN